MVVGWLPQEDVDRVIRLYPSYEEGIKKFEERAASGDTKLDWAGYLSKIELRSCQSYSTT